MLIFCGLLALLVVPGRGISFDSNLEVLPINNISSPEIDYRLPKNVVPLHYDLLLDPSFANFTFEGETIIDIRILEKVDVIMIHAQNLTIDEKFSMLLNSNGSQTGNSYVATHLPEMNFYSMKFTSFVPAGDYKLKFKFTGILHDDFLGFYRTSYTNELGNEVWLAATKFKTTFARRAFPCFDEPALKATFKIRIRHFDNYTAISNMNAISQRRPNKHDLLRWETEFETTPLMSTYLIAFVLFDFKCLSNEKGDFRIYARSNKIKYAKFAQEYGSKILQALIEYTKKDIGLSKIDIIVLPVLYASAMDNWGLITYDEDHLLVNENVAPWYANKDVVSKMAHLLTHQWFGNLITPSWWDYIWLSEGVAHYFQNFITDKIAPMWKYMDQFVLYDLHVMAFGFDNDETGHALDSRINNATEILQSFDAITYYKGASVIRMFSHVITESNFQDGLHKYLTNNENKAVTSDALISSLVAAAPKGGIYTDVDLKRVFESWVQQPGFPVVTVIRNYKTGEASITQKRFLTERTKPSTELWIIPTNYVSEDNLDFTKTAPTLWIPKENTTTVIKNLPADKWIMFNVQQTGYYRVNYDNRNWKMIANYMKDPKQMEKIHLLNRAQLLDDSLNLVKAGELPDYSVFLAITEYLKNEVHFSVWDQTLSLLVIITNKLGNTNTSHLLKLYILSLLTKFEQSLGYERSGEDVEDTTKSVIQMIVVRRACEIGSKMCLEWAHAQLLEYLEYSKELSLNFNEYIYCAGIRSANETTWKKVYDQAAQNTAKSTELHDSVLSALGCSSNKEILKNYLNSTLRAESPFPFKVVTAVQIGNSFGVDLAFDFIKNNVKNITERDPTLKLLKKLLGRTVKAMRTPAQVTKVKEWLETLPMDKYKDLVTELQKDAFPKANDNIQWIEKHEPAISEFLKTQKLIEIED